MPLDRAPAAELRGGIGDALTRGLDKTYFLGQVLAHPGLMPRLASERCDRPFFI